MTDDPVDTPGPGAAPDTGGDTELATRPGLPEDLRYLLGAYPRRIWGDHPNFGPVTKFYLDRHAMFREAMTVMSWVIYCGVLRRMD